MRLDGEAGLQRIERGVGGDLGGVDVEFLAPDQPSGEALLVVASEARAGHAGLRRVPLDGGVPTDLAAGLDRNVMPGTPRRPAYTGDGQTVLFRARNRGPACYRHPLAVSGLFFSPLPSRGGG